MSYRSGNFSEFNHDPRLICNYGCGQNRLGFRLTSDNPLNGFNFVQWHQCDLFFQRHDMVAGIYNPQMLQIKKHGPMFFFNHSGQRRLTALPRAEQRDNR
jgi:hypothetical protein